MDGCCILGARRNTETLGPIWWMMMMMMKAILTEYSIFIYQKIYLTITANRIPGGGIILTWNRVSFRLGSFFSGLGIFFCYILLAININFHFCYNQLSTHMSSVSNFCDFATKYIHSSVCLSLRFFVCFPHPMLKQICGNMSRHIPEKKLKTETDMHSVTKWPSR